MRSRVRKTSRCVAFLAQENVACAIEILGRRLRWRKEGLEYEGCDKHRQALSEGFGLSEDSKTVNSAVVKPEEMGQEEDEKMLEGTERDDVQDLGGDAKLCGAGLVGRGICREGDTHEDGEPNTRNLEKVEEGMQILQGSGEGDVCDAGVETRRCDRGCARGFGLQNGPESRSTSGGMMMVKGTVMNSLVENASFTCAEHG